MKIVYSELKKLLPDLTTNYQQLRDDLTLIGHFAAGLLEVEGEQIYDLEIRQNRGDCQGYYGIAKDLSVFYNIPLNLENKTPATSQQAKTLPIQINSPDVKRIIALSIDNTIVKDSPSWLIKFLSHHEVNTINNIVDATNYIMLLYGIPCHAFDIAKTTPNLIWENNNNKYQTFVTLDGTTLKLDSDTILVSNLNEPLSLSFIGGRNSGISRNTRSTILEMAVYNRSHVRRDSRSLKTITEASIRLDKDLDTETIPLAFNHLIKLVTELSNGQISSQLFENYAVHPTVEKIEFDPISPSQFAGIKIPVNFTLDCLTRLGCIIEKQNDSSYLITPPSIRKDISQAEDLIEEVIRFWGYNKIPLDTPISSEKLPDITPPVLYLIDSIQNILIDLGYDEVRSWPLVRINHVNEFGLQNEIHTQNSINSEYPVLRTSIITSLIEQSQQYQKYKLSNQQFFEIGKIFFKENNNFNEKYSLGIFNSNKDKLDADIKKLSEILKINCEDFVYFPYQNQYFYQVHLDNLLKKIKIDFLKQNNLFETEASNKTSAYELTSQIITLDANVSLDKKENTDNLINKYSQIIGDKYLWKIEVTGPYHDSKTNKYKYTFHASYFNTDDNTAKALHLKSFDLV